MSDFRKCDIVSVHTFETDKKSWTACAPRKYNYFAYQFSGSFLHTFSNRKLLAEPDTLLFINRSEPYSVTMNTYGYAVCFAIDSDDEPPSYMINCKSDAYIRNLFKKSLNYRNLKLESNYFTCMSILYEIVSYIKKKEETEYMTNSVSGSIQKVKNHIDENYTNKELNNMQLAQICNLSRRQMGTLFKEKFSITPNKYINEVRLDHALKLLDTGEYSIGRIAEICGFTSGYYFSKVFKNRFGVSPLVYRKKRI